MKIYFRILLFFICFSMSINYMLYSQQMIGKEMTFLNQLPSNEIIQIYQDNRGFMWLGTTDGLARYDGYNIQVFRSDYIHPNLLIDNYISSISENSTYIFIGTGKGINLLNKETFEISPFPDKRLNNQNIRFLLSDTNDRMWIAAANTLYQCNSTLSLDKSYSFSGNINSIYKDKNGTMWLLIWGDGLFRYQEKTDVFIKYPDIGSENNPFSMLQDSEGHYWISTWGDGLYLFHPEKKDKEMYHHIDIMDDKLKRKEPIMFSLVQDDLYGYIWVLGYSSMYTFQLQEDGNVRIIDTNSTIDKSRMFSQLYKDRDSNIWLGSYDIGHNLFFTKTDIHNYPIMAIKKDVGFEVNLLCLYKDSEDYFWLNQERSGLCLLNNKTGELSYGFANNKMIPVELGNIVASSEKKHVWASLRYVPHVLKIRRDGNDAFLQERIDLTKIISNPGLVKDILEDKDGNLWIKTNEHLLIRPADGVDPFVINTGKKYTTNLTSDNNGNIYIGAADGNIYCLSFDGDIRTSKVLKPQNLHRDDFITIVYADVIGNLWCATLQGKLLMFDKKGQNWIDMTAKCEMQGSSIINILGNNNYLWIINNQSITQHDLQRGTNIKYFTRNENIYVSAFKPKAIYSDGEKVYAGGHGGFVSIRPNRDVYNRKQFHPVQIVDVKTNNKSLFFDEKTSAVQNSIHQCTFSPGDENIEIRFSALKYTGKKKIKYAYQLKGVDKNWIYIDGDKQLAFYNKLGKGEYQFQIKSTDENGIWNPEITSLSIVKLPAFYETWYAYLGYIFIVGGILYLLLKGYLSRIKWKNSLKLQEELAQTKLRYFTSISHELLTPLTIISCATDELEIQGKASDDQVHTFRSNVNRLKKLLLQVLDFRKVEKGKMALKVSKGNISEFIDHIGTTNFQSFAQSKQIDFSIEIDESNLWGYLDFEKIDQILFNLLSNAIKYTPEKKKITLSVKTEDVGEYSYLIIKVEDEGVGIPEKEQEYIFLRFYNNKQHSVESNGIGLSLTKELVELHHGTIDVESVINEGSCFIVRLPISKDAYTTDELAYEYPPIADKQEESNVTDGEKLCILIVDDNRELLSLMRRIFMNKYLILTAENGMEALDIVGKQNIDIIVCDVMMPEVDGLTFCKTLKTDIATSHIPIIMLTAKDTAEDKIACYDVGANAFIAKPFELKVLQARIENLIYSFQLKQKEFRMSKEINLSKLEFQSFDELFLEKAVRCIEEHLDDTDFDVIAFANELNVSKSTLNRKIKSMTGLTTLDFIKNIRLKHACNILRSRHITISEVAYMVGFNNPKYFTNCFKEEYGVTPTEYIRDEDK